MIISRLLRILAGLLLLGLLPLVALADNTDSLQTTFTVLPYEEIKTGSAIKLVIDGDNWTRAGDTFVGSDEVAFQFTTHANYPSKVAVEINTDYLIVSGEDGFLYLKDTAGAWEIPDSGEDWGQKVLKSYVPSGTAQTHSLRVGVRDVPFDHALVTDKTIGRVTITIQERNAL